MRLDRSFFELQAAFAARAAQFIAIPEHEAWRRFTTFYRIASDNDAGLSPERWNFDPGHPAWTRFVDATSAGADPVDWVYQHHLATLQSEAEASACFTYDYWDDVHTVRLHFGNAADGSALRPERRAQRVAELRQIFSEVAAAHPNGQSVRGASWLYHVRAYRDLFPPAFISGLRSIGHLHQFAALWGQFIDRHGVVKAHLRKPFMEKIAEAQTLGDLNSAFPRDVLATISPIEGFYRHFQVDAP